MSKIKKSNKEAKKQPLQSAKAKKEAKRNKKRGFDIPPFPLH